MMEWKKQIMKTTDLLHIHIIWNIICTYNIYIHTYIAEAGHEDRRHEGARPNSNKNGMHGVLGADRDGPAVALDIVQMSNERRRRRMRERGGGG
jgi:hypothetical protein